MALSSDLISQLVKATKPAETKPAEATLYGTVVHKEGNQYVQLDGSDVLTPVTSTVKMESGERVIVSIKNHTAVVTGNLTTPSASSSDVEDIVDKISEFEIVIADKVSTKELDAANGRIDNLVSDNVLIRESLTATKADISDLEADNVVIKETLTTNDAIIKNLEATKLSADIADLRYATIGDLDVISADVYDLEATHATFANATIERLTATEADIATLDALKLNAAEASILYATIEELNATNANINNLQADVADIDTLIFGSASGSTIQASFANAVIAQLGDAQIKSAMINDVAADKITSGDIFTNNVRVMSDDGRLIIADETIQISDANRVRVQIGKDSSNDYSINVWDADGNLMFSQGGITDKAIKDAIIRNDMISATANISASKLDINSLFEAINGSKNTIKSTQIYLDDKAQTLNVAFKKIETDVTQLGNSVTSQGTAIGVLEGKITSKVWQQDIDDASKAMNTKYSALEQTVGGISTTVAQHATQIGKKADSSAVTEVSDKVSKLETNLDGFKSTVSDTYAKQTDMDAVQEMAAQNAQEMANLVTNFNADVENLQTQIDGSITTWFYEVEPTTLNEPASHWTTTELKNTHLGDLYYDTITGYCYRWQVQNNTYSWQLVKDTDVTKALADAKSAQDTADQKRRVFYSTPFPPYDVGDLWVQGEGGDIMRCVQKGTINTYNANHWRKASKYTDDTVANNVNDKVTNLRTSLAEAKTAIEQNTKAIELRATKTELENSLKNYSTTSEMNSAIQVSAESIQSSVRSTYATKTEVDSIEIGGRNLFSGYGEEEIRLKDYQNVGSFTQFPNLTFNPAEYIGEEFTISFYAKSPNGSTEIYVYNQNSNPRYFYFTRVTLDTDLGNEWKYYTHTLTNIDRGEDYAASNKIEIYAPSQMGVLVKKIKVEKGNKATDWTPAPEDVTQSIIDAEDRVKQTVSEKETSILSTTEEIILTALESYVQTGDYSEFKETMSAELSIMADEIAMNFTSTNEETQKINGEMQTAFDTIYEWIRFKNGGVTFGSSENNITFGIENDIIVFKRNGETFGSWDGVDFYTGNIIVKVNERAQFGNFAMVPRSDGSLMFLKVGG